MKYISLFLLLISGTSWSQGRSTPQWMRYPAISPDGATIAFAFHGDIYKVSSSGGEAVPLITHEAHDFMPVWSPDGKSIAFASDRYGNFDIFIVPAAGGLAKRLTFHSTDEYPYDFSDHGGSVLFGATRMDAPDNRQFPSEALQELYRVPVAGGRCRQVLSIPAEDAKLSKDEKFIIYHDRKGRENPWRKHQLSSIARDIWLYHVDSGSHQLLSAFTGEDRSPVFANGNKDFYYLSERSGSFNIYRASLSDTSSPKQETDFKEQPVRFLSIANNNTLCFGYDGQIFIKKKNKRPSKVHIIITAGEEQDDVRTIPVSDVSEMAIAPSGKEVAFIFRGEVFASSVDGTAIQQITHTPGEEAGVSFSPDGRRLLYASERGNTWKIFQAEVANKKDSLFATSAGVIETPLIVNGKENYQPAYSPDGREVAFIEDRVSLRIYNMASGNTRTLLTGGQLLSKRDNDQYVEWSPDSKWLLVQFTEQGSGNEEIGVIRAAGDSQLINLTRSGYGDVHPSWAMGGKMITWYSDRQGLHSYSSSGTRQEDVYALFTDRDTWTNFRNARTEKPAMDSMKNINLKAGPGLSDIGWEELRDTKERLTAQASLLMDALVNKEGTMLYYLAKTEKNFDLWQTDLRTRETKINLRLNLKDASMKWDKEQHHIFLLADGKILKIDPVNAKKQTINTNANMSIDPASERQSMFEHVWRRTAETFYTTGMHGADWNGLKRIYQKFLPGINNNYDFAEMLNELLGELNVSHTGATFSRERKDGEVTASLGIFYDQDYIGSGFRIGEVLRTGPLDRAGIAAGSVIEAIDGEMVDKGKDIAQYLNGKLGKTVLLRINDGSATREVTVKPVSPADENELVYQRWVKRNEEETARLSGGAIGYVHLYRMNDAVYRNVFEDVMGKLATCKAIIVDTRFNRGGDLAPELVMFLSGIKVRENVSDHFVEGQEPSFRWTKPSIVLANEANYSDGHCFVYDYQYLHMGKLVGMPVPGSCTWMTGQGLLDNTLSYSVPTLGVKTLEGKYMENYQTEPDIRVMNEYGPVSRGRDQQLERAIAELANELKTNK